MYEHHKDTGLNRLAMSGHNTAQFVSYDTDLGQRFAWVRGHTPNEEFDTIDDAAAALLQTSPDHQVNVRSFDPHDPKGKPFVYGLKRVEDVSATARKFSAEGLHLILNETVDVNDGGVSGVAVGNVIEFAPKDTPRCVEKPGTAQMPRGMALDFLQAVYEFRAQLPPEPEQRVEFSLHPLRRGYLGANTIIWETEQADYVPTEADIRWPNNFSKPIGDKTYGILVAHAIGLRVPRTMAVSREMSPFTFGTPTGTYEPWIRTSPMVQTPGKFTTKRGWLDPFKLLQEEDPDGTQIAAILRQDGVAAKFSGALLSQPDGTPIIEGTGGQGDRFMVGEVAPDRLPDYVTASVLGEYSKAFNQLGPVRFEWVHDGDNTWIVQLHKGQSVSQGNVIYPGEAQDYQTYNAADGLEGLRNLIGELAGSDVGIELTGDVGVTSHFGDLLRKAQIPSRLIG